MIRVRCPGAGFLEQSLRRLGANLPRIQFRRMDIWAKDTATHLRKNQRKPRLPREVRIGISGRAMGASRRPVAVISSRSMIGYWFEVGTGIFGPHRKRIRSKGQMYTDAAGNRRRRSALRIETPHGFIFRTSVAGMKARPWFFTGISRRLVVLREQLRLDYQRAFRGLSAGARK